MNRLLSPFILPWLAISIIAVLGGGLGVIFMMLYTTAAGEWAVVFFGLLLVVGIPLGGAVLSSQLSDAEENAEENTEENKGPNLVRMMMWLTCAGLAAPAVGIVAGVIGIPMLFFSVVAGVLVAAWSVIFTLARLFGKAQ